eukprot:1867129-Amphidinium_carterae.3
MADQACSNDFLPQAEKLAQSVTHKKVTLVSRCLQALGLRPCYKSELKCLHALNPQSLPSINSNLSWRIVLKRLIDSCSVEAFHTMPCCAATGKLVQRFLSAQETTPLQSSCFSY